MFRLWKMELKIYYIADSRNLFRIDYLENRKSTYYAACSIFRE